MTGSAIELNHVMLYTRDLSKSLAFYTGLLGFRTLEAQPPAYARIQSPAGEQTIALLSVRDGQTFDPHAGGVRLYFEVRDLDSLCEHLASQGVHFDQMPQDMEWGGRHAYLRDPDGRELSLYWAGDRRLRRSH